MQPKWKSYRVLTDTGDVQVSQAQALDDQID